MKIKLTIEVEVDDNMIGSTQEERKWFEDEVLSGSGDLLLHSNEIGDTIGVVKKVSDIEYIKNIEPPKPKCNHRDASFVGTAGCLHCHECGELIDYN